MKTYFTMAFLLLALFAGQIQAKEKAGKKSNDKETQKEETQSVDWKSFERKLETKDAGITGDLAYAGALLHKDKDGKSVVTWMALEKSAAGVWDKFHIDLNNNGKLEKTEVFEAAKNAKNNINFTIPSMKVSGVEHKNVRLTVINDPIQQGFDFQLFVAGEHKNMMKAGYHPGTYEYCPMTADIKTAPIFDFLMQGDIETVCSYVQIPLKGVGCFGCSMICKGSSDEAVTTIGMYRFEKKDLKFELTYPTKDGDIVFKSDCNHTC